MRKFIKQLDYKIKSKEMSKFNIAVPSRYWSNFVRVSGAAEHFYIIKQFLKTLANKKEKLDCLIVGVAGGRDYWGLKSLGHNVQGFDLGEIPECPNIKFGNAEETWPFESQSLDVVVLGEILEHLNGDECALKEARRVLRPEGILIVTVPFLASKPKYHLRIHDPRSIQKLLQANGLVIQDYLERPGFCLNFQICNYLNFFIASCWYLLTGKSAYGALIKCYGKLEWALGHKRYYPRLLLKHLKIINWGATILCRPGEQGFDYTNINRTEFTGK